MFNTPSRPASQQGCTVAAQAIAAVPIRSMYSGAAGWAGMEQRLAAADGGRLQGSSLGRCVAPTGEARGGLVGSLRLAPAPAGAVGVVPAVVGRKDKSAAEWPLVEVGMVAACVRVAEAAGRRQGMSVVGVGAADSTVAVGSVAGCRLGTGNVVENGIVAGLVAGVWGGLMFLRMGLPGSDILGVQKEAPYLGVERGSSSHGQWPVAPAVAGLAWLWGWKLWEEGGSRSLRQAAGLSLEMSTTTGLRAGGMMVEEERVAACSCQRRLVLARRLHVGISRPRCAAPGEWDTSRKSLGIAAEDAHRAVGAGGSASRADEAVALAAGIDGTQAGEVLAMALELFVVGIAVGLTAAVGRELAEKGPDTVVEGTVEDPADPDTVPEWAAKDIP